MENTRKMFGGYLPSLLLALFLLICSSSISNAGRIRPCHYAADILIVTDSSGSVTYHKFHRRIKPFVEELYRQITRVVKHHRTSIANMGSKFNHILPLTTDKRRVIGTIRGLNYMGGATALSSALLEAAKYMSYNARKGVLTVVICVTDAYSTRGRSVENVIKRVKGKVDTIFSIGVSKMTNQIRLHIMSKHSRVVVLPHAKKIKQAVAHVIHQFCKPVIKHCPKPVVYRRRCIGRHWLRRSVTYQRRHHLCLRHSRSSLQRVVCKRAAPVRVTCHKCRRLLRFQFWRIRHCQCVLKTRVIQIGHCCCSRMRRRRSCVNSVLRTDFKYRDLVNGQCWPRTVRCSGRCACPKSRRSRACSGHQRVRTLVAYHLTKNHQCARRTIIGRATIFCRYIRVKTGFCFTKLVNYKHLKMRKVVVVTYKRKGCHCISKRNVYLEPCKYVGRRWKWTRSCSRSCKYNCKSGCFRERTLFVHKMTYTHSGHLSCKSIPLARRRYRCCCSKKVMRRKLCRQGRLVYLASHYRLRSGKCVRFQREVSVNVACCHGIIRRRKILRHGRLSAVEEIHQYKRNCQCVRQKKIVNLRSVCPKTIFKRECRRGVLVTHRTFSYPLGRGCVTRRQRTVVPASCPKLRHVVTVRCYKGLKFVFYEQSFLAGCRCIMRVVKTQKGFCKCPKSWSSKWRCYRHRFLVRRTVTFSRNRIGHCQRRKALLFKRIIGCSRSRWRSFRCNWKTGVLSVFLHVRNMDHCRCKTSKKLIHFARCHCQLVNQKFGHRRKRYCDKRRNQIIVERTYYEHDEKDLRCVRRTQKIRNTIRCSRKVRTHVSRCNVKKRRRRIINVFYRRENCRCRKVHVVKHERCGCASKKVRVTCVKKWGVLVRILLLKTWNRKLDRCDRTKRFIRMPVRCKRGIRVLRSACNGKYLTETRIWYRRKPHSCSCQKLVKRVKVNCYCPSRSFMTGCHGYFKFEGVRYFSYDPVTKQCKPSFSVRTRRRCRCPKPKVLRRCHHGWILIEKIFYKLRKHACVQVSSITQRAIVCTRDAKIVRTKCHRCQLTKIILTRFPHSKTCRCVFRPSFRQRCRCCPCPRSRTVKKCLGSHFAMETTRWRPVRHGGCVSHCVRSVHVRFVRIRCGPRPRSFWTKCRNCKQRFIDYERRTRGCNCLFRRVRTDRWRQCCCPRGFNRRGCRHGLINVVKVRYVLKQFVCVQIKSVVTYKRPCPVVRVPVIVRKCNRRSCKQLYLVPKVVPVPGKCKCKLIRKRLFRKCCCRRKSHSYTVCLGYCWLTRTVKYSFDFRTRQCVRRVRTNRGCLRCRGPVTVRGKCNQKSCFRFVTVTRFGFGGATHFGRCNCRPRATRFIERCCCPPPYPWLRSCEHGYIVRRRKRFVLRGRKCHRTADVRRHRVRCREARIRRHVSGCSRMSCLRAVTDTFERRIGCRCERFQRRKLHVCCCPHARTRRRCVKNYLVTRFTRYYRLVSGRCVPMTRVVALRKITGCPSVRKLSKCNPKTHKRVGYIQTFRVKNCACVRARALRIAITCGCRPPMKHVRRCKRPSCVQKKVIISFMLKGRKCVRGRRVVSRPCCCHPPLRWARLRCNRRTGQRERIVFRKVFVRTARRCVTLTSMASLGIGKNCLRSGVRIVRGGCNPRTKVAHDVFIRHLHLRSSCKCVRRAVKKRRVCACPICKTRRFCRHGERVVHTTCYRLLAGSCHRVTRVQRHLVVCPRNRRVLRSCKGCKGRLTVLHTVRVGCHCVRRRAVRAIVCCCPPLRRRVSCVNPFIETVTVGYVLNHRRTQCRRVIVRRDRRVVRCVKTRSFVGSCNRRTCKKPIATLVYGIRNCQCKVIRRMKRCVTCCCRRSYRRSVCNRRRGILMTRHVSYQLRHGSCARFERVQLRETRCDAVRVTTKPCQHGRRSFVIYSERRVGCSCRRTRRTFVQNCNCPPSRVVKRPCHKGAMWRNVYLVFFRQINVQGLETCKRFIKKLFTERCKCPPPVVKRSCENGARVTEHIRHHLSRRFGQLLCTTSRRRSRAAVSCRAPRKLRGRCRGLRRVLHRVFWRVINCQCRRFVYTRTEACDCHRKNTSRRKCLGAARVYTTIRYKTAPGFKRCVAQTSETIHQIVCRRKETRPLTRSCPIRKHNGFFRQYETIWYTRQRCKCVRHSRRFLRLCHCRRPFVVRRCMSDVVKRTRHSFVRVGLRCLQVIRTRQDPVFCSSPRASLRRGACLRSSCARSIVVTLRHVSGCRCRARSVKLRQLCCAPKPRRKRRCDALRGYKVTSSRRYFLRNSGVLLSKKGVVVLKRVVDSVAVVTRDRVVCPVTTRRVRCNRRTGVKKIFWVLYSRKGCGCVRRTRTIVKRCKCPPSRRKVGRCKNGFRYVRVVFFVMRNARCHAASVVKLQRCSCPRGYQRRFCNRRGQRVACVTRFRFGTVHRQCRKIVTCRSHVVSCAPRRTRSTACNRKNGVRVVTVISHRVNRARCRCERRVAKRVVKCSCSHLNRRKHLCVWGHFLSTVTYRYVLTNGHCALQLRRSLREKLCPNSKSFVRKCAKHGPRAGFRSKVTVFYVRRNCKCIKRHTRSFVRCSCAFLKQCRPTRHRSCVRNVHVIRKTYCALRQGVCRKRVIISRRDLRCARTVRTRQGVCRRHRDGATYKKVALLRQHLRSCSCVWRVFRTVLRVCKCPHSRVSRRCVGNRVWLSTVVRYSRHQSGTHCRQSMRSRATAVVCRPPRAVRNACSRHTCKRRITVFTYTLHACRCVRRRRVFFRACCCLQRPRRHRHCASDGRTIVLRWERISFALGRCFVVRSFETRRVRCERRQPVVRIGPCKHQHRKKLVTRFVTHRCKCKAATESAWIRCGCSAKIFLSRGKCKGRWAVDRLYSHRFRKGRCVRVAVTRRRRCSCPPGFSRTFCSRHNILITKFVSHRLVRGACVRRVVRQTRLLDGCDTKPAVIRVARGRCLRRKRTIRVILVVARHCRCQRFVRTKTEGCDCYRKPRTVRTCRGHGTIVAVTIHFLRRKHRCIAVRRRTVSNIVCVGQRVDSGSCSGRKHRTIRVWHRVARSCRCVWRILRTSHALCRCPRPSVRRVCDRRWRRETHVSYRLDRGRCLRRVATVLREVRCRVGRFTLRSKCSKGWIVITRVRRSLHKCRCLVRSWRRRCRCSCPKPRRFQVCLARRGFKKTVVIVSRLEKCGCERVQRVRMVRVTCGKALRNVGPCKRAANGHYYRDVRITLRKRVNCGCIKKFIKRRQLCKCNPKIRRIVRCHEDTKRETILTRLVRKGHRCVRVRSLRRVTRIVCKRSSKKVFCKGKVKIVKLIHRFVRKCACREIFRIIKGHCKCPVKRHLIHRGPCVHCQRDLKYAHKVLVGLTCKTRFFHRKQRCCCAKKVLRSRHCNKRTGIVTFRIKKLVFVRGFCVWQISTVNKKTRCSKHVARRIVHRRDGFAVTYYFFIRREGCACRRRQRKTLRRWACRHGHFRVTCTSDNKWRRSWVKYRLTKAGCVRMARAKLVPVLCPFTRRSITRCRPVRFGLASRIIRVTFVKKRCHCFRRKTVKTVVCRCRAPRFRKTCQRSSNELHYYFEKFVPRADGRACRRVLRVRKRRIRCQPQWRLVSRTACVDVFSKTVPRGCRCQVVTRRKKRTVRCSKPVSVRDACNYKTCGQIVRIVSYKKQGCHCVRRERRLVRACCKPKCPLPRIVRGHCHRGLVPVRKIWFEMRHGTCKKFMKKQTIKRVLRCHFKQYTPMEPCRNGLRTFKLIIKVPRGCHCVKQQHMVERRCHSYP